MLFNFSPQQLAPIRILHFQQELSLSIVRETDCFVSTCCLIQVPAELLSVLGLERVGGRFFFTDGCAVVAEPSVINSNRPLFLKGRLQV